MFKNLSLAKKLIFGFGSVLILLVVVGFIAFSALERANSGFTGYREMARDANLTGRVQANMLMVRMNVKDYIMTGSDRTLDQFKSYFDKTEGFVSDAQKDIHAPKRAAVIDDIDTALEVYNRSFEKVVMLKKSVIGWSMTF